MYLSVYFIAWLVDDFDYKTLTSSILRKHDATVLKMASGFSGNSPLSRDKTYFP